MLNHRPYKVALNGYGRIGRCVLRALHERGAQAGLEIVALNDLADQASIEYLTRFDSTHGRFPGEVRVDGDCLHINGDCVKVLRQSTPEAIDWSALDIDLLIMATAGRDGIPGMLFGNTAERLLPVLPCSILAIKPDNFVCPVEL